MDIQADLALLEWTRRRMLGRASWVAVTAIASGAASAYLLAPWLAAVGVACGALLAAGAYHVAGRTYRQDWRRLALERVGRRVAPTLRYDPDARWPSGALTAGAVPLPETGLLVGRLGEWEVRIGELRDGRGGERLALFASGPGATDRLAELARPAERDFSLFRPADGAGALERLGEDLRRLLASLEARA